jgi:hypothetical protein
MKDGVRLQIVQQAHQHAGVHPQFVDQVLLGGLPRPRDHAHHFQVPGLQVGCLEGGPELAVAWLLGNMRTVPPIVAAR